MTNTGKWPCAPSTQLAVIGTSFESASVQADLQSLIAKDALESHQAACVAQLRADDRFELVSDGPSEVRFRLVCPVNSLNETMIKHHHHIDMKALNLQLATEVNASGDGALLLALPGGDESIVLVASAAGSRTLLSMWPTIDARAKIILYDVRKKLSECMCGF
ncbi:hypothetical protein SPRG_16896 [Saprolegnia parasitica CBS 223.65]|uniref:Uncharacterized protein n=1 Tax=Saprolegnia parasitica (strain CBS 223.65) TaxID=695850 RepID=A0A067BTV4_SAPPC|nr:hypothetical protein SPRG_16896 [Saprolegnia parasitica CBS 223.65]KDO17691.1 hypothetical protein SPRG_16896 [Saprolegnia parasitica CBS 223.65]|eukprot:XP_012211600.1 hypothetical protein SPRG_16896 [Saprolegnia parasitica CBS 223.65]